MALKRTLGLAFGYALLLGAALLVVNALKVVATAVLASTAPTWAVVAALVVHGGAIILCYGESRRKPRPLGRGCIRHCPPQSTAR